jgi:aryl-alcohol dehydrogenase-like predicted oxidoreductase
MKTKKVAMMDETFSAIGFGCWAIGGDWNNTTDQ